MSVSWSHILVVCEMPAQPDTQQALSTPCFLRFFLMVAVARDQVETSAAIAKTGNAIFQVAQDGAQNAILTAMQISLPS